MQAPDHSLAAVQRDFMRQLYAPDALACAPEVVSGRVNAASRTAVYRNNLHANFSAVLALEFPVLQKLTGNDYFRQLALQYQSVHASRSGNLHHIGEAFALWLTTRFVDGDYRWFADVAAFEWAWQECYVAAEPDPHADLARIGELSEAQQESLRIVLHPACRLTRSRWPVLSIWQAHQPGADTAAALAAIDMNRGENAVLVRQADHISAHSLGDAEAILLACLQAGRPLGAALDQAFAADAQFNAATTMQRVATLGLLVGFET